MALRILCGFGIDEIAEAFLSNKETINKRLFRAKEKLREGNVIMVPIVAGMPSEKEVISRLDNVLHTIYLLFSEGYYSKTQNEVLRKELCLEALRLGRMLTEYGSTNLPKTNALMALMCYHASRFSARENSSGSPILYEQQNSALWDKELMRQGDHFCIFLRRVMRSVLITWKRVLRTGIVRKRIRRKSGMVFCSCMTYCSKRIIRQG
ncbi:DUF6596 domain-containing protein [Paraflavitalea speifideaquila]|uniref:DUF6596 domain-containing protein n=1 Tax=Paraflavitalea speifideaquila TaxID=3076558 RepID=UPI0028EF0278|nr:DUF6596 domain-containing protein [Paraflavitalea speifideiaquila]